MYDVTVGIPVYNAEVFLEECLENVTSQSFREIRILISDNASTDNTEAICRKFCELDSRIQYTKHNKNLGAWNNFRFLLDECQTKYFMWRADDDYSDIDYISTLTHLLETNSRANLAVPSIQTIHRDNDVIPWVHFEENLNLSRSEEIIRQLYRYHASWFYGIWRTSYIKEIVERVWHQYPDAYAGDHLSLLVPILDGSVVGSKSARFTQRTFSPPKGDGLRGEMSIDARISRLEMLMPLFKSCFESEVKRQNFDCADEQRVLSHRDRYTYSKLRASNFRIFRLKFKKMLAKKLMLRS